MADDTEYANINTSKSDAVQYVNCNLSENIYETANENDGKDIELNSYTTLQKTKIYGISEDDATSIYETICKSEGHAPSDDVSQYYVNVDANNYTSLENIKSIISTEDKDNEMYLNRNKRRATSCKWSVRVALILGTIVVAGAVAVPLSLYYSCSLSNKPSSCDANENGLSGTPTKTSGTPAVTNMHDATRYTSTQMLTQTHDLARSSQDSTTLSLTTISEKSTAVPDLTTLFQEQQTASQRTVPAIKVTLKRDPVISTDGFGFIQEGFVCLPYNRIACKASHDDDIIVHVQWLVDSVTIVTEHTSDNLPISEPAILTTNDLLNAGYRIGITVTCRVRPRLQPGSSLGLPRESHFFIGAVPRQTYFSFSETDGPKDYVSDLSIPYIHSTLSLDCDSIDHESHMASTGTENMLLLTVVVPESINGVNECHEHDVVFQRPAFDDGCAVPQNNSTELRVTISVNPNSTNFPNRYMALQISTPESNELNRFWEDYHLPRVQVAFKPEGQSISGKTCLVVNGGVVRTFDQLIYRSQINGFFVLYRHESFPFRVEVSLDGNAALPCKIAARGEGDIFFYDLCVERQLHVVSVYGCYGSGLEIIQVGSGYNVNLPTGTIVKLRYGRISIVASLFDWGKTDGLCGRLNDNQSDDLVHGDVIGTISNPNDFVNSWRVPLEEALYLGQVEIDRAHDDVEFCSCTGDLDNPGALCSMSREPQYCLGNDHALVSSVRGRCGGVLQRKRRSFSDIGEDPRN